MIADKKYTAPGVYIAEQRRLLGCLIRNVSFRNHKHVVAGQIRQCNRSAFTQFLHIIACTRQTARKIRKGAIDDPIRCTSSLGMSIIAQNFLAVRCSRGDTGSRIGRTFGIDLQGRDT
ncbi:hypothetical protein D3C75_884560 [compost metagenome]